MTPLNTRLTTLLQLKYPIMSAPMSGHSGATLAAAVTQAGGLGLFGALGGKGAEAGEPWLKKEIAKAKSMLDDKPFGLGFITFKMAASPALFDLAIAEQVPVFAFSFGDSTAYIKRAKAIGSRVVCQVRTQAQAKDAVLGGADILVAQGNEAGGHTGQTNLMPFLYSLLETYPDIPILAAGGMGSGRNLAAVIAAGADGGWIGTPLIATPECIEVSDAYKAKLIAARADDTLYTPLFDLVNHKAFGGAPWPQGVAARVLRNEFVNTWEHKTDLINDEGDEFIKQYKQELKNKNLDVGVVYAGESVDYVNAIKPAATVIEDICEEAKLLLNQIN